MLLPIGHEETTVRRLPWISFGIMGLCLIAVILTTVDPFEEVAATDDVWAALDYYMRHPYLEPHPFIESQVAGGFGTPDDEAFKEAVFERHPPPQDPEVLAMEQARLDKLTSEALDRIGYGPYYQWGLIPANWSLVTFFTHMFMHAGWLHLIGNMLIFYLGGPFLEDVWGRPIFAGFYLSAGLFAALVQVLRYPDSAIPMVGASGAIAGVMGAFLVRYWHTRIRFFYWFGFVWRGTFDAPAWLMLPLWFGQQLFYGVLTDGGGSDGGVAHWAHVSGFVYGLGFAFALRHFKVEERFVAQKIHTKVNKTVIDNSAVEEAIEAQTRGDIDSAFQTLSREVGRDPNNEDAILAFWGVAAEAGRAAEVAPSMMRLIEGELRSGRTETALAQWADLLERVPNLNASPELMLRVAQAQAKEGLREDAAVMLRRTLLSAGTGLAPAMAIRIARTARDVDRLVAQGAVRLVLDRPDLEPEDRRHAEEMLASLSAPPTEGAKAPPASA